MTSFGTHVFVQIKVCLDMVQCFSYNLAEFKHVLHCYVYTLINAY